MDRSIYQKIIENCKDGVCILDEYDKIIFLNRQGEILLNTTFVEAKGKYVLEYFYDTEIKKIIDSKVITLKVKAGENGKVFGSIGGKEIAEAVKVQLGVEIDKKKISSDSRMKELGQHEVEVKLHHEVKAKIKVKLLGGE